MLIKSVDMNVIELCGGLGNQMFQYAFGRAQMERGIEVCFSKRWYGKVQRNPARPYHLDKLYIEAEYNLFLPQYTVREKHGFDIRHLKKKDCNFKGYWQYLDYFKGILDILQSEFYVQNKYYTSEFLKLRTQIIKNPSVSIHVRRTDYVNHKGFGTLPLLYYFKALEKVDVSVDVYVFSDDIAWCKDVFKSEYFSHKFIFVHLKDYLDFELMRLCHSGIILANSTFGYWAAILDDTPEKLVICPPGWLVLGGMPNEERNKNIPEHWIKIEDYV